MTRQKMKLRKSLFIKKEDKIILILVIILILTYILIKLFTEKSKTILLEYAKNKSVELTTIIINESIKESILDEKINNMLEIVKNESNEIVGVNFNNTLTNKILYKVNYSMLNNIKTIENGNDEIVKNKLNNNFFDNKNIIFQVPFNVINGKPALIGIGPRIPFKIEILGSSTNNILTNVKEYGINNSLVELLLEIEINIQIILPFTSEKTTIKKKIPISTKIIQGKIPEYYGGMISART